jgi:uncharacterized phage protein (TIGR01671 family)
MRTIKFRGKQKSWIYGGISIFNGEATIFDENCVANSAYEVDINTVGQFTGLKDKNGKEIYENDVCAFENQVYRVSFEDGAFCLVCDIVGEIVNMYEYSSQDFEVIGDMHDGLFVRES